ncbi:prephenate dehydrogenase [Corynebacterium halotolerans]|uniref:Prephenate dehydrogenase n=1 Tax=Corynebacterium halotolerans YIM 70093 = DSM 44683 TaxID=1121362 RepID=M1MU86_9CORY|nr:prephenate dehydrogenase [Corynebacterium halotolerans]AGF71294.1 prephenate dehydrogenase [Corynebacterium halotolerans YIM 70093 = DSM 44683]
MTSRDVTRPICIIGLGLIGGSLLRDLAAHGHAVYGFNRSTSGTRKATKEGFEVSNDLVETLRRAEADGALIVLAVPMPAVAGLLDALAEHAPSCGFTDVVSVKAEVYALVKERGMEDRYVGGHPMAGTAESGWSASRAGLFRRAAWVITFDHAVDTEGEVPQEWIELWTDVVRMIIITGAEAIPARVDRHDAAVARISHLPHILAETLAVVGDNGGALAQSLAAGSFRDATRVASTEPELVRAMCETNAPALLTALDEALELLQDARASLASETSDLSELVDAGYRSRVRFDAREGNRSESVSPVKISSRPVLRLHPGGEGWVNQLIQAESLGGRIEVF